MDEKKSDEAAPVTGEGKPVEAIQDDEQMFRKTETKSGISHGIAQSTALSSAIQRFTDKALDFLAHASNETLGACLVGLGATTYLVLGRVGLVIIGVAGGVVLHATWDGIRGDIRDEETKKAERDRRRETGVEVVKRVLEWRAGETVDEGSEVAKVFASQAVDFSNFDPETAAALNTFTDAVIKDYVYYWYGPTLPSEESFPSSCRRTFTAFVLSLSGHLQHKRPAGTFLDFVINASSFIIVFLNELSAALNASPNASAEDAISTYLQLKPDSSLSYLLDRKSQDTKLADAAEDILQAYLDPKAYNCTPVHDFLKQVLAQLVLGSTITLCSRPEWINDYIVYGLEESETTKEVMDIVDAGVEGRMADHKSKDSIGGREVVLPTQEIKSKKENSSEASRPVGEHKRQMSRAEETMDEAMREAKRLTQLMIEEDERRAREGQEKQPAVSSSEDVSDATTHGVQTPTSSQSDRDRQEDEIAAWGKDSAVIENSVTTEDRPSTPSANPQFTSFDQLVPAALLTALADSPEKARREQQQLTLHQASILISDDSKPCDRTTIKTKPMVDYLIQIEPRSSAFSGWMISRKYADFETLHEVLRRISVITGVVGFREAHSELPKWRGDTKASLRGELEQYLTGAVRYQPLAESEGMKRFLEKDQGLSKSPSDRNKAFGWPAPEAFGKFGGDMMNVLTKAPKQVAGGMAGSGKAVFGGVAGLVGGVASKKPNPSPTNLSRTVSNTSMEGHRSRPSIGQPFPTDSYLGSASAARQSQDSLRAPARPALDRLASSDSTTNADVRPRPSVSSQRASFDAYRNESNVATGPSPTSSQLPLSSPKEEDQNIYLPPPPSEMPEDYNSSTKPSRTSIDPFRSSDLNQRSSESIESEQAPPPQPPRPKPAQRKPETKPKEPLSDGETSVAVELMFAIITELYTLSSAWNIRRTLLTAAKTFLLRSGNPQLTTIRDLLQTSMLDANLSDSGMAILIYKLRENALPTAEELEVWTRDYPEKNEEQKEELRAKARKLLVTKGMPQALTSVMGAAASGEALGKVFDCLQVPEVSRGLIFGLMLQALRVVTH